MCGQVEVENEAEEEKEEKENLTDNVSEINLGLLGVRRVESQRRRGNRRKSRPPVVVCGENSEGKQARNWQQNARCESCCKVSSAKKKEKNKRKTPKKEKQSGKSEQGSECECVESRENHGSDRVLRNERECVAWGQTDEGVNL